MQWKKTGDVHSSKSNHHQTKYAVHRNMDTLSPSLGHGGGALSIDSSPLLSFFLCLGTRYGIFSVGTWKCLRHHTQLFPFYFIYLSVYLSLGDDCCVCFFLHVFLSFTLVWTTSIASVPEQLNLKTHKTQFSLLSAIEIEMNNSQKECSFSFLSIH